MRIIGDNSDGFQNEIDLQLSLDFRIFEDLNPNMKHFLVDMFRGYDLKHKRIHAIRCRINVKPDFYVTIDGIPEGRYVSVKKGSGNSIHQEKLSVFTSFLREEGISENLIDDLLRYHYSDGTNNNTGKIRQSSKEFAKENEGLINRLNIRFSQKEFLKKAFDRFVFVGNIENAPKVDYLYHGNSHNGVWASRSEIYDYVSDSSKTRKCVCFGPLTYQAWNLNLKRNPNTEDRRKQIQIKWGSLEETLIEITSRRTDYRQTGTYEGTISEKASVISFNRNPESPVFESYLKSIHKKPEEVLMIRVTTKQLSRLSNQKVNTRADAYAIEIIDKRLLNVLEENEYYLDEEILEGYDDYYNPVEKSGISIKKEESENFTLIKLTPNSFFELFGSFELGYGASVFCKRFDELRLNLQLLEGWHTTIEDLQDYFQSDDINENSLTSSLELCQKMKDISISRIKESIDSSPRLQSIIFNGKDIYDEPYSAYYFMQSNHIESLKYMPYSVTTGSGRSHGDYSIVLKPRKITQIGA